MALIRARRIAAALGGATVVATAALVGASVIGPVSAANDSGKGAPGGRGARGRIHAFAGGSEAMRACAEEAGIERPSGPGGSRPELGQEQRDALQACAEEERAARHDELAQCVEEHGSTLPDLSEAPGGSRPELGQEQRDALQACAEELGGLPPFGPGGPWGHGMAHQCGPGPRGTSNGFPGDPGENGGPGVAGAMLWAA